MSGCCGKLSVVGTPIGNLGDLTPRAREALEDADVVCAEDTRVTGQLLAAIGVHKSLERLDENVMAERIPAVIQRIADGATVAFCSDAGMPAVSDPGARLVAAVREADLPVEVTPGPSAVDTAFAASGCTQTDFYFGGFLPKKSASLHDRLETLKTLEAALIFYESPRRLKATLAAIGEWYPDRRVWVCRELTKRYEEVLDGTADELLTTIDRRERDGHPLKGEIVLVIDGPAESERAAAQAKRLAQAHALAKGLKDAGVTGRTAANLVTEQCHINRNEAYHLIHSLDEASGEE